MKITVIATGFDSDFKGSSAASSVASEPEDIKTEEPGEFDTDIGFGEIMGIFKGRK